MALVDNWIASFLRDGFAHFPHLIDEQTISTARRQIDRDLAENYDASRKVEYDNRSFCPDLLGAAEIMALFAYPSVQQRIRALVKPEAMGVDQAQIAIRQAHNTDKNSTPVPHIDGIPTPHNGVEGDELSPFTMLVGVFLSEVKTEFAGNFTVWSGSHLLLENYFNDKGQQARREGMPQISLGEPKQLLCSPGDVVFCHYQLAHAAAVNTSDDDRYAVFFRMWHHELDRNRNAAYRESGWLHLTSIWTGWEVGP